VEALQQILAVAVVLGLLGVSLWWLKKRGMAGMVLAPRRKQGGALSAVERLPLAPGHTLHLVRLADRAILIAVSPGGCRVMESLPWGAVGQRAGNGE
jgi:flagellar biogenesis protein FliO